MPKTIRIYVLGSLAACRVLEPMDRHKVAVDRCKAVEQTAGPFQMAYSRR